MSKSGQILVLFVEKKYAQSFCFFFYPIGSEGSKRVWTVRNPAD